MPCDVIIGGPVVCLVRKLVPVKGDVGSSQPTDVRSDPGWQTVAPRPWTVICHAPNTNNHLLFLFAVMVVTHQLSPYMVLIGIGGLWLLGGVRPWWFVAAMGSVAVGFLGVHYDFVVSHFGPLFGGDPFDNAQTANQVGTPSTGVSFVANITRINCVCLASRCYRIHPSAS